MNMNEDAMRQDVEVIAVSYLADADGDPDRALRSAISDALADLVEAERRTMRAERLVSRGYVRGGRADMQVPSLPPTVASAGGADAQGHAVRLRSGDALENDRQIVGRHLNDLTEGEAVVGRHLHDRFEVSHAPFRI